MNSIERYGSRGIASIGSNVFTFELQGFDDRQEQLSKQYRDIYSGYLDEYNRTMIGGYLVPSWGDFHNLYPQEVYEATSSNKLLPELLEKQKEYLFGKGPYLYREEYADGEIERIPVQDSDVQRWVDGWQNSGIPPIWEYILQCIDEFYHVATIPTKYHFSKARRIGGELPVLGLECIGTEDVRLATDKIDLIGKIRDRDCKFVMVGDWLNPSKLEFDVYDRFDPSNPFKSNTAVSFVKNKTFTKEVYTYNKWFKGLLDWIDLSNLNPKYLKSYLKNALNARTHVLIPNSWYQNQKLVIQEICERNIQSDKPVQLDYCGVALVDERTGEALEYQEYMINSLITENLRQITSMLSGEGKNQGKMWASVKYATQNGEEKWQFEEIPSKYKEFIESIIEIDKRADQVIITGRGIPASISNVEKDGLNKSSGNDIYYSYMIYMDSLTIPEYFVCMDLNRALRLNFPEKTDIKFGLYRRIPRKLQEITPSERPENTTAS